MRSFGGKFDEAFSACVCFVVVVVVVVTFISFFNGVKLARPRSTLYTGISPQ